MSFDTKAARLRLTNRIAEVRAKRAQQVLTGKSNDRCKHEWKKYKEPIHIDWNVRIGDGPREYSGSLDPHFIVLACHKCRQKKRIELRCR